MNIFDLIGGTQKVLACSRPADQPVRHDARVLREARCRASTSGITVSVCTISWPIQQPESASYFALPAELVVVAHICDTCDMYAKSGYCPRIMSKVVLYTVKATAEPGELFNKAGKRPR